MTPRIIFLQVQSAQQKLERITEIVTEHFEKKDFLLIVTENDHASTFVDELLWKHPKQSFLPHQILLEPQPVRVAITKVKQNLNRASIAFNLCPTPLLIEGPFKIIYEFEDMTSLSKKSLSSLRFEAYKKAGFPIEARSIPK